MRLAPLALASRPMRKGAQDSTTGFGRSHWAAHAALERAAEMGYADAAVAESGPDLESLLDSERFACVVERMRALQAHGLGALASRLHDPERVQAARAGVELVRPDLDGKR